MTRIRVQWLKNHGVRVVTEGPRGRAERFSPPDGYVSVAAAAVALGTYQVKVRRLIERGQLSSRMDLETGDTVVSVRELRNLRGNRTALADQRKQRRGAA